MMSEHIVNIEDLEYRDWQHGDKFEARLGAISARTGAKKLGYNLTVLLPGKRAFPFHSHRVNEEMFFVLEGTGEVRIGEETFAVKSGDVIACPPGGPETAHQLCNTSETEKMKYLAVSTTMSPEIAEYPDSDKTGVYGEFASETGGKPSIMRFIIKDQAGMADYWEDE